MIDPRKIAFFRFLGVAGGLISRIFKAEELNGTDTGATKKQQVLAGTAEAIFQLELVGREDAAGIDAILEIIGDLIDVLVRLFNALGIFGDPD